MLPPLPPHFDTEVDSVLEHFPNRLRVFRQACDLSHADITHLLGVNHSSYYRLESGQTLPRFHRPAT